jgi:hypothetical protein
VQKKVLDMEGKKDKSFQSSVKSKPLLDFDHQARESDRVTVIHHQECYKHLGVIVLYLTLRQLISVIVYD